MITRPTVLLLGAGASAPYGFPTGAGLRDRVCKPGSADDVRTVLIDCGYSADAVDSFVTELRESGRQSVDVFLEHRPDLVPIGKAAIAAALIPFETPDRLFNNLSENGKWYAHLFDQLAAPPDKWAENRLTIVTYNYDRSLEFFLLRALQRSFRLDPGAASALAATLPVIHLHGQLAPLDEVHRGGRPYSPETLPARVKLAAEAIQIISEANPADREFNRARAALAAAERVHILGFGYSHVNLDRLGRSCFPSEHAHFACAYGLRDGEQIEAERWFGGTVTVRGAEHVYDVLTFLRHHQALRTP
jgi:hypothetical protein